jgi:thiamine biosynthesis lipoprotein
VTIPRLIGVLLLGAGLGAAPAPATELYRQSRRIMGTFCEVQVYHAQASVAEAAITKALDEMQRIDRLLSNYDPESELSRMNRDAASGPFHASPELFEFVRRSRGYVETTGGAFDPTVGPLVRAWGFFTPTPSRPSEAAITTARASSGFAHVRLDVASRTVSYTVPGVEIDPGGIGKGLAVDRAAAVLRALRIDNALISAGGSTLYGLGHPPNRASWTVSIRDPSDPNAPLATVALRDRAVSTSGVSEKFVIEGSRRFSHLFDPRTGEPVDGMCQASVIAPTAEASDALTKAAFVLSRSDAQRAFERRGPSFHAMRLEGPCAGPRVVWTTAWSASLFKRP